MDSTLIHQEENLGIFLKHDYTDGDGDTVIQLGGSVPEEMARAGEIIQSYAGARYAEMNINCGCPSPKVVGKCFGAKLMLDPPLVRELVYSLSRRASVPVSVKCRIGADDKDSYEDLCTFVDTVRSAGVQKFIIHARKCHLSGLNPKQNRSVPPLKYDIVHRLVTDFPELRFVLNGGLSTFREVDHHLGMTSAPDHDMEMMCGRYMDSPVHGCMLGRAVYTNPFLLATADTKYFQAATDQLLTRREALHRYLDYCDSVSLENIHAAQSNTSTVKPLALLEAAKNVFHSCGGSSKFRRRVQELYMEECRRRKDGSFVVGEEVPGEVSPSRIVRLHICSTACT